MSSWIRYPGIEQIDFYRTGGFHPIHIDDILNNHYRIINKLGYGAYATVWLAEDIHTGVCVALKVLASGVSKDSELAILRHLKQSQLKVCTRSGAEVIVDFLDYFQIEGPNGTHQCIVTEVLGPSLVADVEEVFDGDDAYPIELAKKLVLQALRGVAYLHSCGIIHGGKQSDSCDGYVWFLPTHLQTFTLETYSYPSLGESNYLAKIFNSISGSHGQDQSTAKVANQLRSPPMNQSMSSTPAIR